MVTGSPHSHAWQWSFMARDLIQDFCSSANTVAMGTKEQLPYNWINIRLLLRHSALCWELIYIPPRAPSTCPWICMLLVIKMRCVSNVCGVAYMADKKLYTDYLGRVTRYTSNLLMVLVPGALWGWEQCCWWSSSGIWSLTETSSGLFTVRRVHVAVIAWCPL